METKKSVVTDIKEKSGTFTGSNGMIYYHTITFANGDTGQYGSKSERCEKFTLNQECDYTIEKKVNGTYTNFVIKPVQPTTAGGGKYNSNPKDQGVITMLSCISSSVQFHQRFRPCTDEDVLATAEKFYNATIKKSSLTK